MRKWTDSRMNCGDMIGVVTAGTLSPSADTPSTCGCAPRSRGAGSRAAALAMTFELIESAQKRWRAASAPHQVALVRAGARSDKGVLVEREQFAAA